MSDNVKAVEDKKEYTAREFTNEYQELCKKMGWRVVVTPVWIARDDGTWSTQLQTSIGKHNPS